MGFKSEEEIEEWFASEKERLETEFLNNITKDKNNIPKYREQFNAEMKRTIAKYEGEYNKILESKKVGKEK